MKYKKIKGTNDILPDESVLWYEIKEILMNIFYQYGFKPEISPILEPYNLFARTVGDSTDIVNKEMFFIKNKDGVVLKPEETAAVFRNIVENNFIRDNNIKKLFYITPIFRYERPQKGRYREFYQYGVEVINSELPQRDAEIIELAERIINSFSIKNISIEINSIGCKKCRPKYKKELKVFLNKNKKGLCNNCKKRYNTNPLRVFDCKEKTCKSIMRNAPIMMNYLCDECSTHFEKLKEELNIRNINYSINTTLVRGLDYYSKTVFEFVERGNKLGSQSQIIGGGRYDYLGDEIGNKHIPSVGFAGGFERLLMAISDNIKNEILSNNRMDLLICFMDKEYNNYALKLCNELRNMGYDVDIIFEHLKLKKQLKYALSIKTKFIVIIGENEFKENKLTIKNLDSKKQYYIDNSIESIKEVLNEK